MKRASNSATAFLLACLIVLSLLTACGQEPSGSSLSSEETSLSSNVEDVSDTSEADPSDTQSSSSSGDSSTSDGSSTSGGSTSDAGHTHSYTSTVTAATCTTGGYTTYTCSCGASYRGNQTAPLNHAYGSWWVAKEPTVSDSGSRVRTCSRCGAEQWETIAPLVDPTAYANEVIRLVNQERAKVGLSPLTSAPVLNSYALQRSKELVSVFDHVRPDGSDPLDYVMGLGGYYTAGENIAKSWGMADTPARVMDGWMNSPGHKANILNPNFSYIGVGCYQVNGGYYWTQIFAG